MVIADVLERLSQAGIRLGAQDGQLQISAPKGAVTQELRALLLAHKATLLHAIEQRADGVEGPVPVARDRPLPPSPAQQRLWFLDQLEGASPAYTKLVPIRLRGGLDTAALQRAVDEIVRRHEVLRCSFVSARGEPQLRIHATLQIPVTTRAIAAEALDASLALEASMPFSLDTAPLLRVTLLRLDAAHHVLVFAIHHIVSDGWSMGLLVREFSALYAAYRTNAPSPLAELILQYPDYALWQCERQAAPGQQRDFAYWRERLQGLPPLLELPTDRPRPSLRSNAGGTLRFHIPAARADALRLLAQQHNVSLYMLLQAAFKVLLARYSGQSDIAVGTPTANRELPQLEGIIGFFAGTVVLRDQVEPHLTFDALLQQVKRTTLGAFAHSSVSFEQLVEELRPTRSTSYSPLFQVMFALQNVQIGALELPGLDATPLQVDSNSAKFDLSVELEETADGIRGVAEYDSALFDCDTVERMMRHYQELLCSVLAAPAARVDDLTMVAPAEQRVLIEDWNQTSVAHAQDRFIHEMFEVQVRRTPDALAVEFGDGVLTYRELNARANRLARHLRANGVRTDSAVAVCFERSLEMVLALFAIAKAGGAYVPVDPDHPAERIEYVLNDSGARLVLTHDAIAGQARKILERHGVALCNLVRDAAQWQEYSDADIDRAETGLAATSLAYIIYTSGSTGRPKGTMNTHGGILNRLLWMQSAYPLSASDRVLQKTPYSFDVSVWEFFWPLMVGAGLVVARPDGHREPHYLGQVIAERGITTLHFVPSMLQTFLDAGQAAHTAGLRRVFCSGEALAPTLARRFVESAPQCELHNLYGPTEAAVDVSHWTCRRDNLDRGVPIGRPIHNIRLYVLDDALRPVPVGVRGQLFISGVGLARGYLGRSDLTAATFVPDPHGTTGGERMYATGDLARFGADGAIEYLGRMDSQVKLRGFRIELGEIDHVLAQHPAVREAVTLVRHEGGEAHLIAYVTRRGESVTHAQLREDLRTRLPEYMVPAIMFLERLPLSTNGKVDRRALPAMEFQDAEVAYVAPRTPTEHQLVAIWREVLKREQVGAEDDFFASGGHSLLATQIMARVRERFGLELPVRALFESPTISKLAERIDAAEDAGADYAALEPVAREQPLPLSFSQQRLWFLDQLDGASATFNIPVAIDLDGYLDLDALQHALQDIVDRHEALRTAFGEVDGQAVQQVQSGCRIEVAPIEIAAAEVAMHIKRDALLPFDLRRAPLIRARLLRTAAQRHVLLVCMHHIVSDGWSLNVLVEELSAGYRARLLGASAALPSLRVQYADFAHWQRQRLSGERLQTQIEYWQRTLAGAPACLTLPTDRPRPAVQSHRGAVAVANLPSQLLDGLRSLAGRCSASLYMVLLAAFDVLLARYSGSADICVGSSIANRARREFEPLIGFFVNTLVLRARVDATQSFTDLLEQVRERVLDAYAHQDVPFEQLLETLQPPRSLSHSPWFQVMLVLQNTPSATFDLPGLTLRVREPHVAVAKFDLSLYATEHVDGLKLDLEYNTDLFDASTMQRLLEHYGTLLEQMVSTPEAPIGSLSVLDQEQRRQQLEQWNTTQAAYPQDQTIAQQFEACVARRSGATAVQQAQVCMDYATLNARANRIAHALRRRGVGAEMRVGICLARSPELIAGLLGILKAGAAYVPLDTRAPAQRLEDILDDAGCALLLTDAAQAGRFAGRAEAVLCLDSAEDELASMPASNLDSAVDVHSAAYAMYTSGSSGRPKAVVISQQALSAFCQAASASYDLQADDRVLQFASIAFDASVEEIFPTLLRGATLVLREEDMLDTFDGFLERSDALALTVWDLPTAFWHQLVAEADLTHLPPTLRAVIIGGERADAECVAQWQRTVGERVRLFNTYGPTEATVVATVAELHGVEHAVPIGRPVQNVTCYVLDEQQQPLPLGATGELYLGGATLARGYLNRADLSAASFVPHPFARTPGARLYRTGDRVRYRRDGALEFVGRSDQQVKIRGFRVEPAEVEAVLLQCAGVRQAVVRAHEDAQGQVALVAYAATECQEEELIQALRARLPDYMLPAHVMCLASLALNANGKIDEAALPQPARTPTQHDVVAPRNPREEQLAAIFAEVLGLERIGVHDDFFRLGGHSLLATQVVSRARTRLSLAISIKTLFERPTVAGLATLDVHGADAPILPRPRQERMPLSYAQQRLWFLEQLQGASATYNMPAALRLRGTLDVAALQQSMQRIVDRHETLRTTFADVDGEPVQLIADALVIEVPVRELAEAELAPALAAFAQEPFDLTRGPLLRAELLRLGPHEHVLLTNMHHIISDGWSIDVLVEEFVALYEAACSGRDAVLRPLPIQYADFAGWQRERLHEAAIQKQLGYWRTQLDGVPALLELPTDRPRPAVQSHAGGLCQFTLPVPVAQALEQLCRREGATVFMGLLAAFQILLARYAGQDDIAVGTPIANRTRQELEPLIGFFVNTLVLRTRVEPQCSFRDVLAQVRTMTLAAYEHQDVPFEQLVEVLKPQRSLSYSPLFQVMFALQDNRNRHAQLPGLELSALEPDTRMAKFDLSLELQQADDTFVANLEYNTDLFDASTMQRLLEHYGTLLEQMVSTPEAPIGSLSVLDQEQRRQQLEQWNTTQAAYPQDQTIAQQFEACVARRSGATAVQQAQVCMDYATLNARANRIAHALRRRGVGAEMRVGICLARSPELIAGLLGILKAGAAYVPLDTRAPAQRLEDILDDAGCALLLTDAAQAGRFAGRAEAVLCLDSAEDELASMPASNLDSAVDVHSAAYAMYTSGSSGRPKAVVISQQALSAFCQAASASYDLQADDRVLQFASIAFDASVEEIFPTLLRGATLVLREEDMLDTFDGFLERSDALALTVWDLPTAFWHQLVAEADLTHLPPTLRAVIIGGERADAECVAQWQRTVGERVRLFNTYGPTEATVVATVAELHGVEHAVPIGRPVQNVTCYVLDEQQQPLPLGATGELYLGGATLARGYLNRADLSAASFVPHPFARTPGARLYRTGDRVRYRRDGALEFVGRSDQQVKIRGFRVEPAEVEAVLLQCAGVRQAVVRAHEDAQGQVALVAYAATECQEEELIQALRARLPDYMLPAHVMCLASLALNANGKIDEAALPQPARTPTQHDVVAPRNPREEQLAAIFAEVLGLERIGVHDDFFRLGGHSLLATQVVSRARTRLSLAISIKTLFERPTVAGLATLDVHGADAPILPRPRQERMPLSYAQQRLWFLEQLQGASATYNMPAALRLRGTLDVAALQQSMQRIVDRHETLRTTFADVDGEPVQLIADALVIEVPVRELAEAELAPALAAFAQEPFDLTRGPLLRAELLRLGPHEHVLLTNMHHIISDGWSIDVLVEEFVALYEAACSGRDAVLRPLPIQYADFAGWQRERLHEAAIQKQLGYWRTQLDGVPALLELPTDRPRPAVQSHAGGLCQFTLPVPVAQALEQLCRREGATVFMGLLAAFQILLARYAGQDDIAVGTPIANRTRQELEPLIGFFVNTLVLRTRVEPQCSFRDVLAQVRTMTLAAYEHQDVPFEQLVEVLKPQRSLSYSPLFQVMFALQDNRNRHAQLPGLELSALEPDTRMAKFDLSLELQQADDTFVANLEYNTDLFDASTMQRLGEHYTRLIEQLVQSPVRPLRELSLLGKEELHAWRAVGVSPAPLDATTDCLHARFEYWAQCTPDAEALVCGQHRLTYAELDRRANHLAHRLLATFLPPESRVAIHLPASVELVVAILAVLKAGGAYLVLDPELPTARREAMLSSAQPHCALSTRALSELLPTCPAMLCVDEDAAEAVTGAPNIRVKPEQLAYVIYTSGSTGVPKGVMIEHARAWSMLQGFAQVAAARGPVSVIAPFAFDASVWELFTALCFGNAAHLIARDVVLDPERLARYWCDEMIATAYLPPALLEPLLGAWEAQPELASLQCVMVGVEPIAATLLARLRALHRDLAIVNAYGPTETAVCATLHRATDQDSGIVPIGRAVPGYAVYLLDEMQQPVPPGVLGEIYIAGAGVGRGYLGDPALSADRFVPDPYSSLPGARCYRSGDLARRLADGSLRFAGRRDAQVKLRGFRIELGEIEAALLAQPRVHRALVVLHETAAGDRQLVAYVVVPSDESEERLREGLIARLPDYMVPAAIVCMDALPLTANGKVDRKALPIPLMTSAASYMPPRTATELTLVALWSEVLKRERVGIHDNFFEIGGHSLLGTQVVVRARRAFSREIPVRQLFETPTVAALASWLDGHSDGSIDSTLALIPRDGRRIPLSYAQERLWFLHQLQGPSAAYNMPAALRLRGPLDTEALHRSYQVLAARQEILRARFLAVDGQPELRFDQPQTLPLPVIEATEGELEQRVRRNGVFTFDLDRGPLLHAELLRLGECDHVLLFNIHHIIADGWSLGVLVGEWVQIYASLRMSAAPQLSPLPVQYADYAHWQRSAPHVARIEQQLEYWTQQLEGAPELIELPTDRARPPVQSYEGAGEEIVLDAALSEQIKRVAQAAGATLFMTLVSAFAVLLSRLSGQTDVVIGTPHVNRERPELENLVGLFLDTLVLRVDLSNAPRFNTMLQRVRKTALDAYAHADVPFERIVEALPLQRDLSRNPLFQVFFNMLNLPDVDGTVANLSIEGLSEPTADAKFDLTMYAAESAAGLRLQLVYNARLFDAERMREMLRQFVALLEQVAAAPDACIDQYDLVTPAARQVLPDPAQALDASWRGAVHEWFAAHVARHPHALAVAARDGKYTYQELDACSDSVAAFLQAQGIGRGDIVAIHAARVMALPVALLGVMKCGATFMLLDPAYPSAHQRACLDVAPAKAWLQVADAEGTEVRALQQTCRVQLDLRKGQLAPALQAYASVRPAPVAVGADDVALIAFTSGSTGKPKAVESRHGPLTHYLPWVVEHFGLGAEDRWSMLSGLAHDPLQRDIFTPLCLGACVCIPHPDDIVPGQLAEWFRELAITATNLTPAMAQILSDVSGGTQLPDLRNAFLIGDVLTRRDVMRLQALAPTSRIVSYYGATETQRAFGYQDLSRESPLHAAREIVPLGCGIGDVQLLVLNAAGRQAGIGECGEVHLRSPHLARGYRSDAESTAARFIRNTFTQDPRDRMYRTGDLGRYLPDGAVEGRGRADRQVKLRGFRIELGEIESLLGRHPDVREAILQLFGADDDKRLVAYVTHRGEAPHDAALREHLRAQLPEHMVPSAFVCLDQLPLTPNGKVDRKALPQPQFDRHANAYATPQTETERALAAIWSEVLKRERVGRSDNFFEIGGHSLLATQVVSRVRTELAAQLGLREIFDLPILSALATRIEEVRGSAPRLQWIPLVPRTGRLALSYAQQRLWFLEQLQGASATYNMPAALRLRGTLDVAALQQSMQRIVDRHETLRTTFADVDGEPVQLIADALVIEVPVRELAEAELAPALAAFAQEPFDLTRGPLLRAELLRLGPHEHVLLTNMHHIISDGWSIGVLVEEFVALYTAQVEGVEARLPQLAVQYADYAGWQRQWLQAGEQDRQLRYWQQQLAGVPPLLNLPTDRPRPAMQTFAGRVHNFALSAALTRGVKYFSQREGVSEFMTLLAAFQALLARYTAQDDITVGTPIANRTRHELEPLIGFFVNTLVLRTRVDEERGFRELLAQVRATTLAAYEHQDVPFEHLVEALRPVRSLSHAPLFQVMFVLQNTPAVAQQLPGLELTPLESTSGVARFDLTLILQESDGVLGATLEYNTDLFELATIERIAGHYSRLLEHVVADADQPLSLLPLLSPGERAQVVDEWNATRAPWPQRACIHDVFEAHVLRDPHAIALVHGAQSLTYAQLNQRANRLAHTLRALGVQPNVRIALCVERSPELAIGVLAILKAGAAYVPLDPSYPPDRLAWMLADSAPRALLTCLPSQPHVLQQLRAAADDAAMPVLDLRLDADRWAREPDTDPDAGVIGLTSGDLAYVIYTSGSTGMPKGVLVEHTGLCNLAIAQGGMLDVTPDSRVLQFASISFDACAWELVMAFCHGATLYLAPAGSVLAGAALADMVRQHRITHLTAPQALLAALPLGESLPSIRVLVVAGEALPAAVAQRWSRQHRLVNAYGPTEATICATWHVCSDDDGAPPIGRPLANTQIYLLDGHGNPVPIGVPGEIHIGGAGVARGYLNRPELTAERFVPDPFGTQAGARIYRTGDIGRFRADGTIEYLGRNDHQVKLRGYRIELGEIEARLAEHADVGEAVVLAREDRVGEKRLVAYMTSRADVDAEALRAHVAAALPEYMVPGAYVMLASFPLTPNGKVDRKALPAPEGAAQATREYVAPQGEVELALAQIWAEVLQVERVGRHDNFFELGGHSLLAVTVVERMRLVDLHADVRALFGSPTLVTLATQTGKKSKAAWVPPNGIPADGATITPEMLPLATLTPAEIARIVAAVPGGTRNIQDIYPLTPLQEGIFFHHLMNGEGDVYLTPILFAIARRDHLQRYVEALQAVIDRHDILRTAVVWEDLTEPMQVVWRQAPLVIEEVALDPTNGDIAEQLRQRFDPTHFRIDVRHAPLRRLFIAEDVVNRRWVVLEMMHHLTSDHTTLEIMQAEIQAHLLHQTQLLPVPMPFRNFVAAARTGVSREEHEAFFTRMLGDVTEPTVPFGLTDTQGDARAIVEARLSLPRTLSERLRLCARALGVSAASVFHVALAQLLARSSGREDVVFGTVLFGRMQGGAGIERVLGMFINTLPLRIRTGTQTLHDGIRSTHDSLTQLMRHEHAPLVLAQQCSGIRAPTPLFTTLLNYRHSSAGALEHDASTEVAEALAGVEFLGGQERTNYPLTLSVDDFGTDFELTAQVDASVGPARICALMQTALESLVTGLEERPSMPVRCIEVLPPAERQQLLVDWNETDIDRIDGASIHGLFEVQAALRPDALALVHEGEILSYAQLNGRADRLAQRLVALGIGADQRVAICAERSVQMVVGLLAILKAGAAYVPLDPTHPPERLRHVLEDSAPTVLLHHVPADAGVGAMLRNIAHAAGIAVLDVEQYSTDAGDASDASSRQRARRSSAAQLAYAIYTSGSTGKPKGVMVSHDAVVNLLLSFRDDVGITLQDRILALTTLAFDIAGLELFLPLITGARCILADGAASRDPQRLLALIAEHEISLMQATPATWRMLIDVGWNGAPTMRALCGGEALGDALAADLVRRVHSLWNVYGPTETTIWSSSQQLFTTELHGLDTELRRASYQPIGRPLANTQIYLLDGHGNLVPIGVPGEIHIGGAGVARGYLNRPELTAERFVPDPFGTQAGARIYRTGDIGRFRADGTIEYLGRNDHQVKLRGYRIELGEIEARLAEHADVGEAVVLAREDRVGEKRLVAYMTSRADVDAEALRAHVAAALPEYMVPGAYVMLASFPLTPNGKVDRKALPAPEGAAQATREYVAPQGEVELALAQIWAEVLQVERVGRHDNFFELGGHSLLLIRLLTRLRTTFGVDIAARQVFSRPALADMAGLLSGAPEEAWTPLVRLQAGVPHRRALFIVHPQGGGVQPYTELARLLGSEQPVYGLQAQGLERNQVPLRRAQDMAESYVAALRSVQPHGPYALAGYSLGGTIALEMAAQLHAAGEDIALLALLDSMPPDGSVPIESSRAELLADVWGSRLGISSREMEHLDDDEQTAFVLARAKAAGEVPPDYDIDDARRQVDVIEALTHAAKVHTPAVYDGSALLFRATESTPPSIETRWRRLLPGGIRTIEIAADHFNLLQQPHVATLARHLRAAVHASDERAAAPEPVEVVR